MRNHTLYLRDILDAMEAIENFVQGMEFDTFRGDDKTSSAVVRKFEIIGEASKNVPEDLKRSHPEVPWKEMAGFRDRLIHFYFGVKHEIVWHTIKSRIPQLKPQIRSMLADPEVGK